MEGFDGGLPQTAQVAVYDQITSELLFNVSSFFPVILVDNLEPGKLLKIEVYAVNSKGRSEPFVLAGYTLIDAEKRSGESKYDRYKFSQLIPLSILFKFNFTVHYLLELFE